jgi:hypothetical protein
VSSGRRVREADQEAAFDQRHQLMRHMPVEQFPERGERAT